jgi:hypothetical protein
VLPKKTVAVFFPRKEVERRRNFCNSTNSVLCSVSFLVLCCATRRLRND